MWLKNAAGEPILPGMEEEVHGTLEVSLLEGEMCYFPNDDADDDEITELDFRGDQISKTPDMSWGMVADMIQVMLGKTVFVHIKDEFLFLDPHSLEHYRANRSTEVKLIDICKTHDIKDTSWMADFVVFLQNQGFQVNEYDPEDDSELLLDLTA